MKGPSLYAQSLGRSQILHHLNMSLAVTDLPNKVLTSLLPETNVTALRHIFLSKTSLVDTLKQRTIQMVDVLKLKIVAPTCLHIA
jgi:hypothetical protein